MKIGVKTVFSRFEWLAMHEFGKLRDFGHEY